jgi:hypothetical protein
MPARQPLNIDHGLPLPEAGQASTVFSLTALFGAYLGIYLILGIPALAGIAFGTVTSLFTIRRWIQRSRCSSFEEFLVSILTGGARNAGASELLLLREISRLLLGLSSEYATLFAIATGLIGYFYVLFGGYLAVYRTDIVQLLLVGTMALVFASQFRTIDLSIALRTTIWPRPGYWEIPFVASAPVGWEYLFQFMIGAVMGYGLLAAAPDAWKRVFVVTVFRRQTLPRFASFVGIGVLPFLFLLPFAMSTPTIPDGPLTVGLMFSGLFRSETLFVAAALGLIASFLSAFNSAVLASVHVGLMLQRASKPVAIETSRFHWLMVTALITIFFLFEALVSFDNPYLLANILLGPYAIVAGMQTATMARPSRLPEGSLLWVAVLGLVAWFIYLVSSPVGLSHVPNSYEVNSVVGAVGIFLAVALTCRILRTASTYNV